MMRREYVSNKILQAPISYKLDQDGFSITTSSSDAYIKWENVVKMKQSKKVIAIYISNHQGYLIPRNQLNTEQTEFMEQLILANANRKSHK